jgi:hypothetical protein
MAPTLVFIDGNRAYEAVVTDNRGARRIGARAISDHDFDAERFHGTVRAVDEGGGAARRVGTLSLIARPQVGRAAAESST